jgi:hypothetical protein
MNLSHPIDYTGYIYKNNETISNKDEFEQEDEIIV